MHVFSLRSNSYLGHTFFITETYNISNVTQVQAMFQCFRFQVTLYSFQASELHEVHSCFHIYF